MSVRFENNIIMPCGPMGITSLMGLSNDDLKSVERWHRKEWDEFRTEIVAYKQRMLNSKYHQRGFLSGSGVRRQTWKKDSAGDCTFTTSTVPNLSDFTISPTIAYTRARLHTDGDWYSNNAGSWGATDGTWKGGCAIADYDSRWNLVSGDAPNDVVTGTDGVWSDASVTGAAVGYLNNNAGGGALNGSFSLEIRDGTTLNVLFTDTFTMNADQDAKN